MERAEYLAGLARKRVGAGVLFFDAAGRILLVEPTYKDHWEIPGGAVEADESPGAGAVREIEEELGLGFTPGPMLVVDWVAARGDKSEGLMFVFDGGTLSAERAATIALPADELRSWAWCDQEAAARRLPDLLARRVSAARRAREAGVTAYLENGSPVG
ncbi:NUDIX hydrolase [Nocardia sp. CDC159]|uniref:NUDIX hydrolase n=1 Tax=Nocardia pulmonis TaxID=2951408 RepID=A0A9X2E2I0_9NOCA|nr:MULTISPECIES: NUDIX hydrolase [Nocardia]MCM6773069.1 NUDIX hydrolase [Nocardia pulmonis]MCM6785628.1 NUDIX hydrolase [Nocardia sp. CDC159]